MRRLGVFGGYKIPWDRFGIGIFRRSVSIGDNPNASRLIFFNTRLLQQCRRVTDYLGMQWYDDESPDTFPVSVISDHQAASSGLCTPPFAAGPDFFHQNFQELIGRSAVRNCRRNELHASPRKPATQRQFLEGLMTL